MSAKIVDLQGEEARTPDGGYPHVIKMLKEALESAWRGEIAAVGLIAIRPNRDIHTLVSQNEMGRHAMMAGCSFLLNDLISEKEVVVSDENKRS